MRVKNANFFLVSSVSEFFLVIIVCVCVIECGGGVIKQKIFYHSMKVSQLGSDGSKPHWFLIGASFRCWYLVLAGTKEPPAVGGDS